MELWMSNEQDLIPLTEMHEELVRHVARRALELAGASLGENVGISVLIVDDAYIQALNHEHRGLDKPTDVLSFSQMEGEELAAQPAGEPLLLGDIVVSVQRCRDQAVEYGHSFERELGFLVVHGMLHLLGFDHQTPEEEAAMMAKTEEILGELGLTR